MALIIPTCRIFILILLTLQINLHPLVAARPIPTLKLEPSKAPPPHTSSASRPTNLQSSASSAPRSSTTLSPVNASSSASAVREHHDAITPGPPRSPTDSQFATPPLRPVAPIPAAHLPHRNTLANPQEPTVTSIGSAGPPNSSSAKLPTNATSGEPSARLPRRNTESAVASSSGARPPVASTSSARPPTPPGDPLIHTEETASPQSVHHAADGNPSHPPEQMQQGHGDHEPVAPRPSAIRQFGTTVKNCVVAFCKSPKTHAVALGLVSTLGGGAGGLHSEGLGEAWGMGGTALVPAAHAAMGKWVPSQQTSVGLKLGTTLPPLFSGLAGWAARPFLGYSNGTVSAKKLK